MPEESEIVITKEEAAIRIRDLKEKSRIELQARSDVLECHRCRPVRPMSFLASPPISRRRG